MVKLKTILPTPFSVLPGTGRKVSSNGGEVTYNGNRYRRSDYWLMGIGAAVLLVGVAFYLVARSPDQVYFLPDDLSLTQTWGRHLGVWTGSLPSFVHGLALVLITSSVVGCRRFRCVLAVSIGWLAVDLFLEFAQHPMLGAWLAAHTPEWFSFFPVLENTKPYFMSGTFDHLDLAATLLGVVLAVVIATLNCYNTERR